MMKGCGCNKVEGMRGKPANLGGDCVSTEYGCCPDGTPASSLIDDCLSPVVGKGGRHLPKHKKACPANGVTEACYSDDQRCIHDPSCSDPTSENFDGRGCIVKPGWMNKSGKDVRTECRICGDSRKGYQDCPRGVIQKN